MDFRGYFSDFNADYSLVKELFDGITRPETICDVPSPVELCDYIAIHVRLSDYLPSMRVDVDWYVGIVSSMLKLNPSQRFKLFSDGTEEELAPLLKIGNVEHAFYGNAFADMTAISRCKFLIASDSTFSAWGAFLGQKPIIFSKRHFPAVYRGDIPEAVLGNSVEIPEKFVRLIANR